MGIPETTSQRWVAFLRAINVGGHTVKMSQLRELFIGMAFGNVETFIASGNVIFEAASADPTLLERQIERHLRQALGYDVATFIRSTAELGEIAAYQPFTPSEIDAEGTSLFVAFLSAPPSTEAAEKLLRLRSDVNDFAIHGREIYWLCRTSTHESRFSGAALERTVGMPATLRNITTVKKLASKYPAP